MLRPVDDVRRHLTIVLDPATVPDLAATRHRWDPVMASGVPPHVTVVYPEEGVDVLTVGVAADPFRLALCGVTALDDGAGGVFVEVDDIDGGWAALRERAVAGAGSARLHVQPHVTIVHPRTSDQGRAAWTVLRGTRFDVTVTITEIAVTDTSREHGMVVVERWPLGVTP